MDISAFVQEMDALANMLDDNTSSEEADVLMELCQDWHMRVFNAQPTERERALLRTAMTLMDEFKTALFALLD